MAYQLQICSTRLSLLFSHQTQKHSIDSLLWPSSKVIAFNTRGNELALTRLYQRTLFCARTFIERRPPNSCFYSLGRPRLSIPEQIYLFVRTSLCAKYSVTSK